MSSERYTFEPWRTRVLGLGAGLFACWLGAGMAIVPRLLRSAYAGDGLAMLTARMSERATLPLEHYLDAWQRRFWSASAALALVLLAVAAITTPRFYMRFVHGRSARDLAKVRIVVAGILFGNTLWEDLASTALLPREFIRPMGIIDLLYRVPGFSRFAADATALRAFQACTAVLLLFAAVGYRARVSVPLGAACALVMGGLLRQYCHLFHTMSVPLLMLCVLALAPCADALSLDAAAGRTHAAAARTPRYSWFHFASMVVVALSYTAAGTSKLQNGGLMWWSGDNLKHYILADTLGNMPFDWGAGLALKDVPAEYLAPFGFLALLGESSFALVLFSAWARRIIPVLMLGMHLGIFVFQNFLFVDLILILALLFVWPTIVEIAQARRSHGFATTKSEGPVPVDWAGASGRLSLGVALLVACLLLVGAFRVEYYPLSGFQMYAGRNRSSVVRYERVFAVHRSGRTRRAALHLATWALADGRWQDNLWRAFDPSARPHFHRYLETIAPILSARTPGDPIVGFSIERWDWDYASEPVDDSSPGRRVESAAFELSAGKPTLRERLR